MKKKKMRILVATMCMVLTFGGCGASASFDKAATESMSAQAPMAEEYKEVFYEDALYEESGAGSVDVTENGAASSVSKQESAQDHAAVMERKLIKTVDMNVETKEFDATMTAVEEKVVELGGYIENLETYNGSSYSAYRSSRHASMTIRIPKNQLETFLETVSGISNVVRRSESVEDVTLKYVDLDSHKRVLQTEQETLLALLEKAEAIEDIITIESRLSQVRYQIESMESQLRTYDNKVNYSTIYLNVEEVRELTPIEDETAWQKIKSGFSESIRDIRDGAVDLAVWFVVNIPYFIVWAVVLTVLFVVVRLVFKWRKYMRNKKSEKKNKPAEENSKEK